jgi:DNA-binding transcriptional MerR regulator
MKIAELSRRAGVPIPTIKFYIRAGMLPRGEPGGRTQARYSGSHLDRLALIGTLRRVGLSLAMIKQALRAMDAMSGDVEDFMAIAINSLAITPKEEADASTMADAEALLRAMVAHRGWAVDPGTPAWEAVVHACAGISSIWPGALNEQRLEQYAAVAEDTAAFEIPEEWNPTLSPPEALQYAVLGTILFEPLILALRRLAHVDRDAKLRARRVQAEGAAVDQTARSG